MIVEIINPSDKAYMQHDEPKILAIAAMAIGNGYGLRNAESEKPLTMPTMPPLFSASWFEDEFGEEPQAVLDSNRQAVADALASVRLASSVTEYRLALGLSGDELEEHHDERRSSLNDFADYARRVAAVLRAEE